MPPRQDIEQNKRKKKIFFDCLFVTICRLFGLGRRGRARCVGLILKKMKPAGRKIRVWAALVMQGHKPRRDVILLFLAPLILLGVSELCLDGVFGTIPLREHLPKLPVKANNEVPAERVAWLSACVDRTPRLARPRISPPYRLHLLNRYLFCLAASPMLAENAIMLDANDGAGGTGFALFLGARLFPERRVIVSHEDNEAFLLNFGVEEQKTISLTRDLEPLETIERGCAKGVQLASVAGGTPLADFVLATTALQCASARWLALTGVEQAELERVRAELLKDWNVVVVGVDYLYYSPLAIPLCWLRIPLLCTRVPFAILAK